MTTPRDTSACLLSCALLAAGFIGALPWLLAELADVPPIPSCKPAWRYGRAGYRRSKLLPRERESVAAAAAADHGGAKR